ncbi:MAG: nitrous-oxide reductase, partial [Chthoniobacterales bacterium]
MKSIYLIAAASLAVVALVGCDQKASTAKNERAQNAEASYVAPGEKDEYYLFYSGGHSGQVFVAGIPSMRHISTIPVFAPYPGAGYGFDVES